MVKFVPEVLVFLPNWFCFRCCWFLCLGVFTEDDTLLHSLLLVVDTKNVTTYAKSTEASPEAQLNDSFKVQ